MCTAIAYKVKDLYFGRNLDLEYSYHESVTITPRKYLFPFQKENSISKHYAIIGIATIANNYPLYYDGVNEYGLSMAALNFPGNAFYLPEDPKKCNITPYELIPWILGQCRSVAEAYALLLNINIVDIPFSEEYPLTPLHWMISDKIESLTIEPLSQGLKLYRNPVGVLTNNPPFDYHLHNLCNYMNLTSNEPETRFSTMLELKPFSRGMGGIGLPGDLSSQSRFVRAAFTKFNCAKEESEEKNVGQFFHILGSVNQQKGCVKVNDKYEKTVYSSCCNTNQGIYYYTTYYNHQITAVKLFQEPLDSQNLISYPLLTDPQIRYVNE